MSLINKKYLTIVCKKCGEEHQFFAPRIITRNNKRMFNEWGKNLKYWYSDLKFNKPDSAVATCTGCQIRKV